jgi:hypothetical protein
VTTPSFAARIRVRIDMGLSKFDIGAISICEQGAIHGSRCKIVGTRAACSSVHDRTTTDFTLGCRDSEGDQDRFGDAVPAAGAPRSGRMVHKPMGGCGPARGGEAQAAALQAYGRWAAVGAETSLGPPAWNGGASMGYLIDIMVGAISRILTGELSAHMEPMARWIIGKATDVLPADDRDRFREEWLAHLDETPGTLRKLWHAVGCYLGATKVAGAYSRPSPYTTLSPDEAEILNGKQHLASNSRQRRRRRRRRRRLSIIARAQETVDEMAEEPDR